MENEKGDRMKHVVSLHGLRATRDHAREDRDEVERVLARADTGDVVEVDLTGVSVLTVSYADELLGRLIEDRMRGGRMDRALIVTGADPVVRETIEVVLGRRGVGVLYNDQSIGKIEAIAGPSWFASTVQETNSLRDFRAADLAERLDLTPQAANNRLKQLAASGAVLREQGAPAGGGKQFLYRAVTSAL
jgi:hypothetical protein